MNNKIYKISLFSLMVACVAVAPSFARVISKNSNRSYADAYQQVNAIRYQSEMYDATSQTATTASATDGLPVVVDDKALATAILDGSATDVSISDLEACSMIYPNGVFRWTIPESGVRRNQIPQCSAVIELRDATTNAVLATTTLAAGDVLKCNIDSFPESGMALDVRYGKIELPADAAPTEKDVEKVMNQEQKQNAGIKIAAGAILSGVAGNILAPKEAGNTKLFGTGKTQLIDTAIGAASGAAIMAASTYSGKVAGDTIKSTAVNAASGMVVGNMLAGTSGGGSFVTIQKCTKKDSDGKAVKEYDCVPGVYAEKNSSADTLEHKAYFMAQNGSILLCDEGTKGEDIGKYVSCSSVSTSMFAEIKCLNEGSLIDCKELIETGKENRFNLVRDNKYKYDETGTKAMEPANSVDGNYIKIVETYTASNRKHAFAVFPNGIQGKKVLGNKSEKWSELKTDDMEYYIRNNDGSIGDPIKIKDKNGNEVIAIGKDIVFEPSNQEASDGGLVDISNKARAKGTLVGTAAGGAMGGFAGYQGAKTELSERWTEAVREYNDSLSNFVCMCGGRFLTKYNDYVEIPEAKKLEQ